ncbi:MAG: hypothetical protein V1772_11280, partial [Chloroflexota bacterium]
VGRTGDAAGVGQLVVNAKLDGQTLAGETRGDGGSPDDTAGNWLAYAFFDAGDPPDGSGTHALEVNVTDRAGRAFGGAVNVTIDVVAPATVSLTIGTIAGPLTPPETVRAPAAPLTLTWGATTDAGGLPVNRYAVDWLEYTGGVVQSGVHSNASRLSAYAATEAQRLTARLRSTDLAGNVQEQALGPVYVDGPATPDFVFYDSDGAPYGGWMDSGCSLIGTDRRVSAKAPKKAALDAVQRLYATWDAARLRLAWTGANWNTAGDLFIYLDTIPGQGTDLAMDPYGSDGDVYLPGATPASAGLTAYGRRGLKAAAPLAARLSRAGPSAVGAMEADYLVWVEDDTTASLWKWVAPNWSLQGYLGADRFRFHGWLHDGHTDLLLPFSAIGATAGGALDLVAFAVDEGELNLWAAMPPDNPVSSDKAAKTTPASGKSATFALTQRYAWPALGPGICPNGSVPNLTGGAGLTADVGLRAAGTRYVDASLSMGVTVEPEGSVYAYVRDGLFWLWPDMFAGDRPIELSLGFEFMDYAHQPLGHGDPITYVLACANTGTEAAAGVYADLAARYALRLLDGITPTDALQVAFGVVPAGETVTRTVRGVVDLYHARSQDYDPCIASGGDPVACERTLQWALLDARFYDDAHPTQPFDWAWVDHSVDPEAPRFYGITSPGYAVAAGKNTLHGYAYDNSRVARIDLEIQPPAGGSTTVQCPGCAPVDNVWSYGWDLSGAADGALYGVRVRAVDEFYQEGDWGAWRSFRVDGQAPTLSFDAEVLDKVADRTLRNPPAAITGAIADNLAAARVEVCYEGGCQPVALMLDAPANVVVEQATNAAIPGCAAPLEVTFNVTPTFPVGEVRLGLNATHPHRDDIRAELIAPDGATVPAIVGEGSVVAVYANYDVQLYDGAGSGLHAFRGDDDVAPPHYGREARPSAPLDAFVGRQSQGNWKLRVCDTDLSANTGAYHRAQLTLIPMDRGARTGRWSFTPPRVPEMETGTQTFAFYGFDTVGNRSTALNLTYRIDRVSPVLALTGSSSPIMVGGATAVVTGTVSDWSQVTGLYVTIVAPDGRLLSDRLTWASAGIGVLSVRGPALQATGGNWGYSLIPSGAGLHQLYFEGVDAAGNTAVLGPVEIMVKAPPPIEPPPVGEPTPTATPWGVAASVKSDADIFCPGWNVGLVFRLRNTTQAAFTHLVVTDKLGVNTCCPSDDPANPVAGAINPDNSAIAWSIPTLGPGQELVLRVGIHTFTSVVDEGEVLNTFVWSADQPEVRGDIRIALEADTALCGTTRTPTPTATATPTLTITPTPSCTPTAGAPTNGHYLPLVLKAALMQVPRAVGSGSARVGTPPAPAPTVALAPLPSPAATPAPPSLRRSETAGSAQRH